MLTGLPKYLLAIGAGQQDDLLGLIKDGAEIKPSKFAAIANV